MERRIHIISKKLVWAKNIENLCIDFNIEELNVEEIERIQPSW